MRASCFLSKQEWKQSMAAQMRLEQEAREQELRQQLSKQRDEQIKLVITRLSAETQLEKQELQRTYEARLASVEQQHRDSVADMERRLREWEVKYYEVSAAQRVGDQHYSGEVDRMRRDLEGSRAECERLRGEVLALSTELAAARSDIVAVREEAGRERRAAEGKLRDAIASAEADRDRARAELTVAAERLAAQLSETQRAHAQELEQVCVCVCVWQ